MLYTIGHKASYDKGLKDIKHLPLMKVGVRDDYSGGIVFRTEEEAKQNCPEGYDVYGLDVDWNKHTYWCGEGYQALIIDRPIIDIRNGSVV